ncbi:MAG: SDR family oxidoreductase [Planctomycetaceae bacterium]|nr:SDR family oxidoreductase [Planctomycetaceae bacterium]
MIAIDLSGHTAVVTGASGQLGRAMVRTLARAGADVAVCFLKNQSKADELAAQVEALGRRSIVVQVDVTAANAINVLRDRVAAELAPADIIVNNAVIQYPWKGVLEQPSDDFESQFRSCVMHNVLMAQAFVPGMIARKWGRVIGINTECAMQCAAGQGAYASAKRGMDGVLRVLAREVGQHGITVNEIAPGWTISEDQGDDSPQAYRDTLPLRRRGTDQEIANVVAFVASDLASYITGAYIPVCGGNIMPAI